MSRAGRGCLAVIDMQRVFAEPGSPWLAPRFARGRRPGPPRWPRRSAPGGVHQVRRAGEPAGAWQRYYEQWPFALQPPDAPIYQLVDEFAARAGPTLDATTFSKWGPELAGRVGDGGPLVLAGVSTDCCVLSTALAAADDGVAVQVVADACAGLTTTATARHWTSCGCMRR